MNATLVWDLPTRISHWILAAGVFFSAAVALLLGEHSPLFPFHSLVGLVIALLVALRVLWGFVGSRHARFSSFAFGPAALAKYLASVAGGKPQHHAGHNPGSAYAIFAMLALVLTLAITGVLMASGSEAVEEIHELAAYALVGVVAAHLLGVAIHTLRCRENITLGMITGRKDTDGGNAITSAHPMVAAAVLAVVAGWAVVLWRGYEPSTGMLRLPGVATSLQLTESEGAGENGGGGKTEGRDDDDDER